VNFFRDWRSQQQKFPYDCSFTRKFTEIFEISRPRKGTPTKAVSYERRFWFLLISVSGALFPTFGVISRLSKTQNLFLIVWPENRAGFSWDRPIPR
jgi:hypothetical protein